MTAARRLILLLAARLAATALAPGAHATGAQNRVGAFLSAAPTHTGPNSSKPPARIGEVRRRSSGSRRAAALPQRQYARPFPTLGYTISTRPANARVDTGRAERGAVGRSRSPTSHSLCDLPQATAALALGDEERRGGGRGLPPVGQLPDRRAGEHTRDGDGEGRGGTVLPRADPEFHAAPERPAARPTPRPRARVGQPRGCATAPGGRGRSTANCPPSMIGSPSADSRPPRRRSQMRSQWSADSFLPPVSG